MGDHSFAARYFGSAGTAAIDEESRTELTVAQFKHAAGSDHGTELIKILKVATILVNGQAAGDGQEIPSGATVDVLPPFAGG